MGNDWLKNFAKHINGTKIICDSKNVKNIYHYTSPKAIKSILSNGKLRFTDRYFLNDYSEGNYVIQLCLDEIDTLIEENESLKNKFKKALQERKHQIQQGCFYVYQCSFSIKRDSLCMWNYYTKGQGIQGYCIRFLIDNTKDIGSQIFKPDNAFDEKKHKVYSGEIIYTRKNQIKIVKKIVDYFLSLDWEGNDEFVLDYLVDKIIQQGIFFKKDCFSVEEEYRFAIIQFVKEDGHFYAIKDKREFYEKDGIFVPYVDISFDADKLTEIMISPTLQDKIIEKNIKAICANNYPNLKVEHSEIPVRY